MSIRIFVLLLSLLSGAANAATYHAQARLTVVHADRACLQSPTQKTRDCGAVEQVRAAFAATTATLFTPDATRAVEVVVTVTDVGMVEEISGYLGFLEVRTSTRVLTSTGTLIDQIDSVGRTPVTADTSAEKAAQAAAESAATDFAERLFRSSKMRDYAIGTRIATPSDLSRPRGDRLLSLGAGGALVQGGGDGDAGFGLSIRGALSIRWFTVQAVISVLQSSFQGLAGGRAYESNLKAFDLGVEAGVALRLGPHVELRAGPGVHSLFASADGTNDRRALAVSGSAARLTPSVFASLSTSILPRRSGSRFVVGIEGRGYLATRVDLPDFNRGVPMANTTFGLFLGGEFPLDGGSR